MSRKIPIKILLYIFISLLAILLIYKFVNSRKGERTFKGELFKADTTKITAIYITPKNAKDYIKLFRDGKNWMVSSNGKTFSADDVEIGALLNQLNNMRTEYVAAIGRDSLEKFQVTRSTGTTVKLEENGKKFVEFYIGRFAYSAPQNPYDRNGKMTTFVRLDDDDQTYAINGFLQMAFRSDVNEYRNKLLVPGNKPDWNKLIFSYPSDSSFVLEKVNKKWLVNNQPADSLKVESFLLELSGLKGYSFVAENGKRSVPFIHRLRIEGKNMIAPVIIETVTDGNADFDITSSMNSCAWFSGKSGLFSKIFKRKTDF